MLNVMSLVVKTDWTAGPDSKKGKLPNLIAGKMHSSQNVHFVCFVLFFLEQIEINLLQFYMKFKMFQE